MRLALRFGLVSALLGAAMVGSAVPALGANTIVVTCTNGFQRTVAAHAARGVAKSLTKFNEHNQSGVTCAAAPGAPRPAAQSFRTVTCSNGFERRVNARAAGGITRALNAFNERNRSGVTCTLA